MYADCRWLKEHRVKTKTTIDSCYFNVTITILECYQSGLLGNELFSLWPDN